MGIRSRRGGVDKIEGREGMRGGRAEGSDWVTGKGDGGKRKWKRKRSEGRNLEEEEKGRADEVRCGKERVG